MTAHSKLKRRYKKIVNGIAFIPFLLSLLIFLLGLAFIWIQQTNLGRDILLALNFIDLKDVETVRSLLSALIAGMISLTVFSFTMVMVVVNQSASNYSPKVIEGFITRTENQVILGVYIGAILFMVTSLTQVGSKDDFEKIPHFNVFGSVLLIALCIGLFILFIQNISNSVRINNVAERIFNETKKAILKSAGADQTFEPGAVENWFPYKSEISGYLQSIETRRLLKQLRKHKLVLKVIPYYGNYVLKEHHLFCLNKEIEDEEFLNTLRSTFTIYSGENIAENYFYGFRQLREVAVKALSPGINDPGIAIICLDYLSELLALYLRHEKEIIVKDGTGHSAILLKKHDFPTILTLSITPIQTYGRNDYLVLSQILKVLGDIALYDSSHEHREAILEHTRSVCETAETNIHTSMERSYMNGVLKHLSEMDYFDQLELGRN